MTIPFAPWRSSRVERKLFGSLRSQNHLFGDLRTGEPTPVPPANPHTRPALRFSDKEGVPGSSPGSPTGEVPRPCPHGRAESPPELVWRESVPPATHSFNLWLAVRRAEPDECPSARCRR